jgi:hypothetical protein
MSMPGKSPFGMLNSYQAPPPMARPLGVRGHQNPSNLTASITMGHGLFVESPLERSVLRALDVDPRTTYIAAQPFTVRLDIPAVFADRKTALQADPHLAYADGLELIYTPDFEVKDRGQVPLVIEVKQKDELKTLESVLTRRRLILKRLGYRFLVVTDGDVGQTGLDRNLVFVRDALKALRHGDAQAHLDELLQVIAGIQEPFRIGSIRQTVPDFAIHLGVATGAIALDLRAGALSMETIAWPAHGDLQHLQLLNLEI